MAITEEKLKKWSYPPSNTEKEKCDNAISMIKKAISHSEELRNHNIRFIPKGSYYNNTNVRVSSDVDISVVITDSFFPQYPHNKKNTDFNNSSSKFTFEEFYNILKTTLLNYFGEKNVVIGDKSIKISSNTYRIDADVVPCFEHRRYSNDGSYIVGTEFISSYSKKHIINFPEQHFENSKYKNLKTSKRYKKIVRILKKTRNEMIEDGHNLDNISSFLIESLVWNAPDCLFNNVFLKEDIEKILIYLIEQTSIKKNCEEWGEVSELLYLFRDFRKFTLSDVQIYLQKAYKYIFED